MSNVFLPNEYFRDMLCETNCVRDSRKNLPGTLYTLLSAMKGITKRPRGLNGDVVKPRHRINSVFQIGICIF